MMVACGHTSYKRFGKTRHGEQRYRCLACGHVWFDQRPKPLGKMQVPVADAKHALHMLVEGSFTKGDEVTLTYDTAAKHLTKIERLAAEEPDGGNELFNGRDLTGWGLKKPKTGGLDTMWIVDPERKVLISPGGNGSNWLESEKSYNDFVLSLEYRFPPGGQDGGNGSGVVIRSAGFTQSGYDPRGIEIELKPKVDDQGSGTFVCYECGLKGSAGNVPVGAPIGKLVPSKFVQKPVGNWNKLEIECNGDRISVKINDELVNEGTGMKILAGRVSLRNQSTAVEFRNIRLGPLSAGVKPDEGDFEALLPQNGLDGLHFEGNLKKKLPNWANKNGILLYKSAGQSLISDDEYYDFEMQLDFNLPKKCNCGVLLRGRYEVKLTDTPKGIASDLKPDSRIGAIYARLVPTKNAYKGTNQWNKLEVKLVGKTVTVKINDETVIDEQYIPAGRTPGAAAGQDESTPGPITFFAHPKGVGAKFRNVKVKRLDRRE